LPSQSTVSLAKRAFPRQYGKNFERFIERSGLDRPARLRIVADTYGLDAEDRHILVELLDGPMESGGSFVQRRVEAGDPNFIRMLDEMGGMKRYERRLRWWRASRETFVGALR
jgi:hypothetical protein